VNKNVVEARQLTYIHRGEDNGSTVWNTFNVIQENAMKGDYQINGAKGTRKARPIIDITRQVDVNTRLWKLAEEFVQ